MSGRDDELAVRALHDGFCAGFAQRDAEAVLDTLADTSELTLVTSEAPVLRGTNEVGHFLERYVAGATTYSWAWQSQEVFVSGAFAWLLARGTETAASETERHENEYRMTGVAQKANERWRFLQVHGSSPHELHQ